MRESFDQELKELENDSTRMGDYVVDAVGRATTALAEGDVDLARLVMDADETIDQLYLDIETRAYEMLAKQQPVAKDLRLIISILRVIQDLERAGDLAKNIAEIVRNDVQIIKLKNVAEIMGSLGLLSQDLLRTSVRAFKTRDVALADSLEEKDNKIDDMYRKLIKELFRLEKESSLELAVNMSLVGRYFERIADHSVNIAIWVNYLVTGILPG